MDDIDYYCNLIIKPTPINIQITTSQKHGSLEISPQNGSFNEYEIGAYMCCIFITEVSLYFAVVSVNVTLKLNVSWVQALSNATSDSFKNVTKQMERNVSTFPSK